MKLYEYMKSIDDIKVVFRIFDENAEDVVETLYNNEYCYDIAKSLYKDFELKHFEVKYLDKCNMYEVTVYIDRYDDTVYALQYYSMSDNCQKTVHLTYDQMYSLQRTYEDCHFSKDFHTYLNLVFSFNK